MGIFHCYVCLPEGNVNIFFFVARLFEQKNGSAIRRPDSAHALSLEALSWSHLDKHLSLAQRNADDWGTHRIHGTGIFTYMILHEWLIFMVNVGKYTIHGSYGGG